MKKEDEVLHELYDIGILYRGIHACLEIIGGILAILITPNFFLRVVTKLTQGELLEDPKDYITQHLINFANSYSPGTKHFIAFYLISHGIINLVIVTGLYMKKIWAYYASFVTLTIFCFYQIYRYIFHPSILLILLTAFDVIIIWLIWREYKRVMHTT